MNSGMTDRGRAEGAHEAGAGKPNLKCTSEYGDKWKQLPATEHSITNSNECVNLAKRFLHESAWIYISFVNDTDYWVVLSKIIVHTVGILKHPPASRTGRFFTQASRPRSSSSVRNSGGQRFFECDKGASNCRVGIQGWSNLLVVKFWRILQSNCFVP